VLAKRLCNVEASVLEEKACPIPIGFKAKTDLRILDRSAHRPREDESATAIFTRSILARRIALENLAANRETLETNARLRWHPKGEAVPDNRLKVVGIHPVG